MSKENKNNFFWASYADMMTSLFFVMFILFIVTIAIHYKDDPKNLLVENTKLKKRILELENNNVTISGLLIKSEQEKKQLEELRTPSKFIDSTKFRYESVFKRFTLKKSIEFPINESIIPDFQLDYAKEIGKSIVETINAIKNDSIAKQYNPRYLVIIEGTASRSGDEDHNFNLSYRRGLSLYKLWKKDPSISSVLFNENEMCEVLVAGSGYYGVGRYPLFQDEKNQRFLIQIIPKIDMGSHKIKTDEE